MRLAAADVGSNYLHLTVAEIDQGELGIIAKHEIPTRLSQEVDDDGRISLEKMTQIATLLKLFKAIAESYAAEKFLVIATEATRSANNADQFVDFLRERANVDVQVVSGELEAALTFCGATYDRKLFAGQLVVDIGGGSTELIAANRHHVDWMMTIPIGSGRMTDRFFKTHPPTNKQFLKLRRFLDHVFSQVRPDHKIRDVIFTGGSAQTLHHIVARDQAKWKLKRKELNAALKRLQREHPNKIAQVYETEVARIETLAAGICIAQAILHRFDLRKLRISPQGIRSGLILTYAQYGDEWNKHIVSPDIVRAPSPLDHKSES